MKKVASISKITNKYVLETWLLNLPWKLLDYEIDELIARAKGNNFIMLTQSDGFKIW